MIASTTQLNTPGLELAQLAGVHALTDVTGFGLLGHLLEVCKGSKVAATIDWDRVPLLPGVRELVQQGHKTGASGRNWAGYGAAGGSRTATASWSRRCSPTRRPAAACWWPARRRRSSRCSRSSKRRFRAAAVIGEIAAGEARVIVA